MHSARRGVLPPSAPQAVDPAAPEHPRSPGHSPGELETALVRTTVEVLEDDVWVAVVYLAATAWPVAEHVGSAHCVAYGVSKEDALGRAAALWRAARRRRRKVATSNAETK